MVSDAGQTFRRDSCPSHATAPNLARDDMEDPGRSDKVQQRETAPCTRAKGSVRNPARNERQKPVLGGERQDFWNPGWYG